VRRNDEVAAQSRFERDRWAFYETINLVPWKTLSGTIILPIGKDHVFPREQGYPVSRIDNMVGRNRSMVDHHELNPLRRDSHLSQEVLDPQGFLLDEIYFFFSGAIRPQGPIKHHLGLDRHILLPFRTPLLLILWSHRKNLKALI